MNHPENKTLASIFAELANEQGLKDNSLLLDIEKEEQFQKLQKKLDQAYKNDTSHTRKLSENSL